MKTRSKAPVNYYPDVYGDDDYEEDEQDEQDEGDKEDEDDYWDNYPTAPTTPLRFGTLVASDSTWVFVE